MTRPASSRLRAGIAAGVLAAAASLAVTAGAAQASTAPGPNTPEKVPTGLLASSLPGSSAFGDTPSSTPEQVSFILKERNKGQLESAVTGSGHRFDSVGQFAAKYGPRPDVVKGLTAYLAAFGLKTTVYPGNVDVSATGTAGQFDKALSTVQKQYHVPAQRGAGGKTIPAQTVYSATAAPKLPYRISKDILAVLGLTNYAPFVTHSQHLTPALTPAGSAARDTPGNFLPSDFAASYGLAAVGKKANGAGTTLGIVTLATVDPGAPQYFWRGVAHVPSTGRTVTPVNIDGGSGAPSDDAGTGETDLDVEQAGGLAPGANILIYQAPNTDPGFVDAFFAAAASNQADTVSTSWGESETFVASAVAAGQETVTYEAAFDEAFLQLADQGQSLFASSGDDGAYDAFNDLGSTNLSVDTPADSPYLTAAGGTTLPFSATLTGPKGSAKISVARQRAWGWDYLWAATAKTTGASFADTATSPENVGGDGGGFSVVEPKPSYQYDVSGTSNFHAVRWLTPTDFQVVVTGTDFTEPTAWNVASPPPPVSGAGSGRALPDLSANADPESGYLLYEPSAVQAGRPVLQGGWGGTSFVSPQFNGSAAVIDSYLGHRTGLWNPGLYALAAGHSSPVTPLNAVGTSNDNLYYTGNPGQRFNPATGLGIPDLTKFATELAAR